MKYLIFPYTISKKDYVDAYPIHNNYVEPILKAFPGKIWDITEQVSRNQARKEAYRKWINCNYAGWNKFSLSLISDNFKKENSIGNS